MPHDLIQISTWPSMPAPWSSVDPGEAWVWNDYVVLFQTKPRLLAEVTAAITGRPAAHLPPIEYLYAMTVFFRPDRHPDGPSHRPVLVATLERLDLAAAGKLMGARSVALSAIASSEDGPVMKGLFTADARLALGEFDDELTRDSARDQILNLIRRHLALVGEPVKIGAMADVHGHPSTGWPAQEETKPSGCLTVLAALFLLITPAAVWTFVTFT